VRISSVADATTVKTDILAALRALSNVGARVSDGALTKAAPVDAAGYVLPYVILFAGSGDHPDEVLLDGTIGADGRTFDFQTTSVGPAVSHTLAVDAQVQKALINLRVGRGRVRPNPDGFSQRIPIREENITPIRYLLPRQWRLNTN
jgi:hypothetical protein